MSNEDKCESGGIRGSVMKQPDYRQWEIDKYIYLYEKPREKKSGRIVNYGSIPGWRKDLLRGYYKEIKTMAVGGSILDVGCGRGESIRIAEQVGISITGAEVVPKLCNEKNVICVPGAHDLPFSDRSFSAISCVDVMEHIPEQDADLVFQEFARVAPEALIGISLRESAWKLHNLHITLKDHVWWMEKLVKAFRHVMTYPYKGNPQADDYLVVRCESPS